MATTPFSLQEGFSLGSQTKNVSIDDIIKAASSPNIGAMFSGTQAGTGADSLAGRLSVAGLRGLDSKQLQAIASGVNTDVVGATSGADYIAKKKAAEAPLKAALTDLYGEQGLAKIYSTKGNRYAVDFLTADGTRVGGFQDKRSSGFFSKALDTALDVAPIALGGALAFATGGALAPVIGKIGAGAIAGGLGAVGSTGDPKNFTKGLISGGIGAFAAPAITGLSGALSPTIGNTAANFVSKGLVQGTSNAIQGRDFLQGAVMGALPGVNTGNKLLDSLLNSQVRGAVNKEFFAPSQSKMRSPGTTGSPRPRIKPPTSGPSSGLNINPILQLLLRGRP